MGGDLGREETVTSGTWFAPLPRLDSGVGWDGAGERESPPSDSQMGRISVTSLSPRIPVSTGRGGEEGVRGGCS